MAKLISVLALVLLLSALTFTSTARAAGGGGGEGWEIDPALMYLMMQTQSGGSSDTYSYWLADVRVGYKFSSPIFLGAQYDYENIQHDSTGSTTTHTVFNNYGPTFGLMTDNLYFLFTYYISTKQEQPAVTYTGTSGFQLDFGYIFNVGSSWGVGPQVSYRSLHYTSQSPGGGSVDLTYNTILPYVAFQFHL